MPRAASKDAEILVVESMIMKKEFNSNTHSSSVEHVVEVSAKRRLILIISVTQIVRTKSRWDLDLDGGASQG